jgi:hypothetical protein
MSWIMEVDPGMEDDSDPEVEGAGSWNGKMSWILEWKMSWWIPT